MAELGPGLHNRATALEAVGPCAHRPAPLPSQSDALTPPPEAHGGSPHPRPRSERSHADQRRDRATALRINPTRLAKPITRGIEFQGGTAVAARVTGPIEPASGGV